MTGTGVHAIGEPSPAAVDVAENPMVFFVMKSARRRVWDEKNRGVAHGVKSLAMRDLCVRRWGFYLYLMCVRYMAKRITFLPCSSHLHR